MSKASEGVIKGQGEGEEVEDTWSSRQAEKEAMQWGCREGLPGGGRPELRW